MYGGRQLVIALHRIDPINDQYCREVGNSLNPMVFIEKRLHPLIHQYFLMLKAQNLELVQLRLVLD